MPNPKKRRKIIRKAFTLTELIVVVVIVGILASLSVPMFSKTMETTKGKEGNVALDQVWAAEKIYRTEEGFYYPKSSATENAIATINSFLRTELDSSAGRNWNFSINSATNSTFTATASRLGGGNNGETLTIDQDRGKGGTFSP